MSTPNCNQNDEQSFAADKEYHALTQERFWMCTLTPELQAREVAFTGVPGDGIFFGSLTVHRSDANVSDHHRRCVVMEFDRLGNLEPRPGWGAPVPPVVWT